MKSRTRVIFCRVTEEEFLELAKLCESTGARSMSDLVRSAIDGLRAHQDQGGSQLAVLIEQVAKFETRVEQLIREINHRLAADGVHDSDKTAIGTRET
jgi:hypothetical protein